MTMNAVNALLLTDLAVDLPAGVRQQRLTETLRLHFRCGAVALLRLDGDGEFLRPVAVDGLSSDALGRRFAVKEHPRLAAILRRREITCFHHDSGLPDPYDAVLDAIGLTGQDATPAELLALSPDSQHDTIQVVPEP